MSVDVVVRENEWQNFILAFIKQHPNWRDILTKGQLLKLCSHMFVNRTPARQTESTSEETAVAKQVPVAL